jgi:hypothetical protein
VAVWKQPPLLPESLQSMKNNLRNIAERWAQTLICVAHLMFIDDQEVDDES